MGVRILVVVRRTRSRRCLSKWSAPLLSGLQDELLSTKLSEQLSAQLSGHVS